MAVSVGTRPALRRMRSETVDEFLMTGDSEEVPVVVMAPIYDLNHVPGKSSADLFVILGVFPIAGFRAMITDPDVIVWGA